MAWAAALYRVSASSSSSDLLSSCCIAAIWPRCSILTVRCSFGIALSLAPPKRLAGPGRLEPRLRIDRVHDDPELEKLVGPERLHRGRPRDTNRPSVGGHDHRGDVRHVEVLKAPVKAGAARLRGEAVTPDGRMEDPADLRLAELGPVLQPASANEAARLALDSRHHAMASLAALA